VPSDTEALAEESSERRDGEPDNRARVPLDVPDERLPATVDREGPGDRERLAARDVGIDLTFGDAVSELDDRILDRADAETGDAPTVVDEPVAGVEHAAAAHHVLPPRAGHLGRVGFSVDHPVELEGAVAAEDEPVDGVALDEPPDDGLGLRPRELADHLGGAERTARRAEALDEGLLVDAGADESGGLDAGGPERGEPRWRCRGEIEAHRGIRVRGHGVGSYARGMADSHGADSRGTQVELDVTNIAHGGVGVARLDGRVVFVADAIPGERVVARITDDSKKSFWRAETLDVVDASPHRRAHVWAEASIDRAPEDRAGGAEFGHIDPAHQRELKRQVLADSLQRMASIESDVTVEAIPGEPDGTGWRTRLRLHVAPDGTLGPYAARSHTVVPVASVPLATQEVARITPLDERFTGSTHVDIVAPSSGNAFVLAGDSTVKGRPKAQRITEVVGDREFRVDVRGFWQVHRAAAETLSLAVQEAIDAERFDPRAANQDLYGGVGLFAAAVGDRFGSATRITTVESDSLATDHAGENLVEWMGARAVTARVDRYLRDLSNSNTRLDGATVVLDPPRSGAGREVVDALADLGPAQLVYVACDPVALARDLGLLRERGYALRSLRAFDLFPNTHHVEAVASVVKV
jgi:tRNA/tmRNA/rRNA uracil-C5-methylase (TrmA/RlmC/RlmD family)